jgi:hypothetical protein
VERGELPEVVRLPDDRLEPFEPERITRSLFATLERVGKPDAFLARELTEGVLHFLAVEATGNDITPADISWIVVKVVRELGHPELARAFEERRHASLPNRPVAIVEKPDDSPAWLRQDQSPAAVLRLAAAESLSRLSRTKVFSRELISAHDEGLILIRGLEHPLELAGVCALVTPGHVLECVESARAIAGQFLAIDGPEYDLATESGDVDSLADRFVRELGFAAGALGLSPILNLNIAGPPRRLAETTGPLFSASQPADVGRQRGIALALAHRAGGDSVSIWWHLTSADVQNADSTLQTIICLALDGRDIQFVFDHPRLPVALAPGIDRQVPATLIHVGINLARLVELMGGPPVSPGVYLQKVASLARFAKTAAHAKQDFVRQNGRPAVRSAFLVDRARIVLETIGLNEAARASDRSAADFAREILKTVRLAVEGDRPRAMAVRLDCSPETESMSVAEPGLPLQQQAKFASPLHAAAGGGRLDLQFTGAGDDLSAALEALRVAAETHVNRVCLCN